MVIFFTVPLIVILYLILLGVAAAKAIMDSFGTIMAGILTCIIVLVVLVTIAVVIKSLVSKKMKKDGETSSFLILTGISFFVYFFVSIPMFPEMVNLDKSDYFMNWFGWNTDIKSLCAVITFLCGGLLIISISALFNSRFIHFLFLIGMICYVIWFPNYCATICAQSYSDYKCKDADLEAEILIEYEIESDADIFYNGSSGKVRAMYPVLSPFKFTYDHFDSGETVLVIDSKHGEDYVLVTNGEKAGFVESEKLSWKDKPEYTYHFEISETADVYEHLEVEKPSKYYEYYNGNETHLEDEVVENIIAKLEKGVEVKKIDKEDDYWLIQTEDGIEGYVELKYIDLIREKIS